MSSISFWTLNSIRNESFCPQSTSVQSSWIFISLLLDDGILKASLSIALFSFYPFLSTQQGSLVIWCTTPNIETLFNVQWLHGTLLFWKQAFVFALLAHISLVSYHAHALPGKDTLKLSAQNLGCLKRKSTQFIRVTAFGWFITLISYTAYAMKVEAEHLLSFIQHYKHV